MSDLKDVPLDTVERVTNLFKSNVRDADLLHLLIQNTDPVVAWVIASREHKMEGRFSQTPVDVCLYEVLQPLNQIRRNFIPYEEFKSIAEKAVSFVREVAEKQLTDVSQLHGFAQYEADIEAFMLEVNTNPRLRKYLPTSSDDA